MEAISCRLLPYATADGPHNMAADEVLLETAAAGVASLRFYGWSEATLSLGYFQPERLRHTDARLVRLPYVRRPSGGDALVHHHELTYAVALPAGPPWHAPGANASSWLRRMHTIIAAALASLDVAAELSQAAQAARWSGVLCFQHLTPGDLLIGGAKVVGSAQRRQRGALLQHGGVLLATSPHAPHVPGIHELAGKRLMPEQARAAIVAELARQTGWRLEATDWDPSQRRRTEALVAARYALPAWNRKR